MRAEAWSRCFCASFRRGSSVMVSLPAAPRPRPCAGGRPGPCALERAFDAAVLGGGVDALGGDALLGLVVGDLRLRQLRFQRADAGLDALQLGFQLVALPQQRRLVALGARDALLLLDDAAAAVLHLLHEVLLDLALRALGGLRQLGELLVVGLPALGIEQALGLLDLALLGERADVGDHAAHLVEGADLGGALALLGREDGVEVRSRRRRTRRPTSRRGTSPTAPRSWRSGARSARRAPRCRRRAGS